MTIIRNSIWNIVGYVIPTIIAIPSLGYLARSLGVELFGIYTIAIAIVGYAGIFDVGLTRAIVREIALFKHDKVERLRIISTATTFIFVFSLFGIVVILNFIPQIISLLKVSSIHIFEAKKALILLVLSIPLFLINQLWMSILEADEKFFLVNVQRSLGSSVIAGLPAVFILFKAGLVPAILGLIVGRIISLIISFVIVRKEIVEAKFKFHCPTFKRLIFFGGWITVSNIISPVMVYFDRFVISSTLGAKVVGYYTAPSEAISRLSLFPGALSRAVFPRLSSTHNRKEFKGHIIFCYKIMILACLPVVIFGILFSEEILNLWLGQDFARKSSYIFSILLVGFLFNSIAQIPFTAIQSVGKAKVTALLHCAELLPYLLLLTLLVGHYGIIGAAYAWTIRVIVDCLLLMALLYRYIPK